MGASKTEEFTELQNQLSIVAKALGHPARIAIIDYLLQVESCICGDIVQHLPLSQPTISQHLKELKNAKLIKGNFEGLRICYCLDPTGFEMIKHFFEGINHQLNKNKCC